MYLPHASNVWCSISSRVRVERSAAFWIFSNSVDSYVRKISISRRMLMYLPIQCNMLSHVRVRRSVSFQIFSNSAELWVSRVSQSRRMLMCKPHLLDLWYGMLIHVALEHVGGFFHVESIFVWFKFLLCTKMQANKVTWPRLRGPGVRGTVDYN